jgi:DNA polymerase-3 subunit alpha
MEFIPEYISRKKNPSTVTYLDARMESILQPTYGILIYQDDVMMIAVELAGFTWMMLINYEKLSEKRFQK